MGEADYFGLTLWQLQLFLLSICKKDAEQKIPNFQEDNASCQRSPKLIISHFSGLQRDPRTMETKTGRGRVHGVHIIAQRQGSSLPDTLLQAVKENVCQKRVVSEAEI